MRMLVVFLSALLLGVDGHMASTPRAAAVQALSVEYRLGANPPPVKRVNVSGRYAVVEFAGTSLWQPPPRGNPSLRLLMERFSFGWQAIDEIPRPGYPDQVNDLCGFRARAIAPAVVDSLLSGMPRGDTTTPCSKEIAGDSGPPNDVDAVRAAMSGTGFIPWVIADGNYATVEQFALNGVDFGKLDGTWVRLSFATVGRRGLIRGGVPAPVACRLLPFDPDTGCASGASAPSRQEQEAVVLVEHYYALWGARHFADAYTLLSSPYRRAHPYQGWLSDHASTGDILVDTARASDRTTVALRVIAHPVDPESHTRRSTQQRTKGRGSSFERTAPCDSTPRASGRRDSSTATRSIGLS